jgi:hypothetical protein
LWARQNVPYHCGTRSFRTAASELPRACRGIRCSCPLMSSGPPGLVSLRELTLGPLERSLDPASLRLGFSTGPWHIRLQASDSLKTSEILKQRIAQRQSVAGPFDQYLNWLLGGLYKFSFAIGCGKALLSTRASQG